MSDQPPLPAIDDSTDRARRGIHWTAAVTSGVVAGMIFAAVEMVLVPIVLGRSSFLPATMIGSIVLGPPTEMPPAGVEAAHVFAGTILHLTFSALYGVILAWITHKMEINRAVMVGAIFGLALYFVNFYVFAVAYPWFDQGRNWVTIFSHIVFGASAAWIFHTLVSKFPELY